MEKDILEIANKEIVDVVKNSSIKMTLNDWAAASVLITLCLSGVAICGIKTYADVNLK